MILRGVIILESELVSSTLILLCDFMEFFPIYYMQGKIASKHTHDGFGDGIVLFMLMLELKYRLLELELQDIKC